jgi:hypothetical protein
VDFDATTVARFVDKRVDRRRGRRVAYVLPEGADRIAGTEIASRTFVPPPVASGASLPAGLRGCLTTA